MITGLMVLETSRGRLKSWSEEEEGRSLQRASCLETAKSETEVKTQLVNLQAGMVAGWCAGGGKGLVGVE